MVNTSWAKYLQICGGWWTCEVTIMLGEMTSGIQFGASSEHGSASFRCLFGYNTSIRLNKTDSYYKLRTIYTPWPKPRSERERKMKRKEKI